ncbi:MAG TPA: OsmC family protein [Candidatus Tyrphobacter sp.]
MTPAQQPIPATVVMLERKSRYEFLARIEGTTSTLSVDEGPPLGEGNGASPDALLGAAIGSCLASSFLFCVEKARVELEELSVRVNVDKIRNEHGRIRIGAIGVEFRVKVSPEHRARLERCRDLFGEYCTVTESVRQGIPVDVAFTT